MDGGSLELRALPRLAYRDSEARWPLGHLGPRGTWILGVLGPLGHLGQIAFVAYAVGNERFSAVGYLFGRTCAGLATV